jgi:Zn-dependent protease with chaperone function
MAIDFDRIRIREEQQLLEELRGIFNAQVIGYLLDLQEARDADQFMSTHVKENYLPLTHDFTPELSAVCTDVVQAIGYQGKAIEFFVDPDPNANAYCWHTPEHVKSHFVVLNAGLLTMCTPEELKFVVGHEIGHLLFEHARFERVFDFVYPQQDRVPPYLRNRHVVWRKFNEMSADRVGAIAAGSFEAAAKAMLKVSTGLDTRHFGKNLAAYLQLADKLLEELAENRAQTVQSHPGNPLRLKALQHFSESALFAAIKAGKPLPKDKPLAKKMEELAARLKLEPQNALEAATFDFLSAAGFMLVVADEKADDSEVEYLYNLLSQYYYYPREYVNNLVDSKKIVETMKAAATFFVEKRPEMAPGLMEQLLPIVLRDRRIETDEIKIFMKLGMEELQLPEPQLVDMLLSGIREKYTPMA